MTEQENIAQEEVQEEAREEQKEKAFSLDDMSQEERVQAANAGIRQVMERYNVDFDLFVILRAGMVIPQLRIVPVEMLQQTTQAPQQAAPSAQGASKPIPPVQSTVTQ